ncbi:hypothetical protein D3C83_70590 [compost metagenome]
MIGTTGAGMATPDSDRVTPRPSAQNSGEPAIRRSIAYGRQGWSLKRKAIA